MHKSATIIGYGWLGSLLGTHLKKLRYRIKATTTTPSKLQEIHEMGFEAHLFNIENGIEGDDPLLRPNIHIFCIPPSKIKSNYAQTISGYITKTNPKSKIIFISSTSVYPNETGNWNEESDTIFNNVREAEKIISGHTENYLILRCGGLFDENRHPGNFLAGKMLSGASSTVNLVHGIDVCRILGRLAEKDARGIFNIANAAPFTKKELYTRACKQISTVPPKFDETGTSVNRIINTEKTEAMAEIGFDHTQKWYDSLF